MVAQTKFWDITEGPSWYGLTHSKGVFIKEASHTNKIIFFKGQIRSLRARATFGPRVVCCACLLSLTEPKCQVKLVLNGMLDIWRVNSSTYILVLAKIWNTFKIVESGIWNWGLTWYRAFHGFEQAKFAYMMVVWFKTRANFHYCPIYLKNYMCFKIGFKIFLVLLIYIRDTHCKTISNVKMK